MSMSTSILGDESGLLGVLGKRKKGMNRVLFYFGMRAFSKVCAKKSNHTTCTPPSSARAGAVTTE